MACAHIRRTHPWDRICLLSSRVLRVSTTGRLSARRGGFYQCSSRQTANRRNGKHADTNRATDPRHVMRLRGDFVLADSFGSERRRAARRPGARPVKRAVRTADVPAEGLRETPASSRSRRGIHRVAIARAVDDAPACGLRLGRGDQQALPLPARPGADRTVSRVRSSDQMGYDPDHPIGTRGSRKVGVSIATWRTCRTLFEGIPLDRVSTSMTINATASIPSPCTSPSPAARA